MPKEPVLDEHWGDARGRLSVRTVRVQGCIIRLERGGEQVYTANCELITAREGEWKEPDGTEMARELAVSLGDRDGVQ